MISSGLSDIHQHTADHRDEILNSSRCFCIYCMHEFKSDEIDDWIDEGDTALCPHCGIDAVIGDASGFNLTPDLLHRLHKAYFW